jgi:hypothetical protein
MKLVRFAVALCCTVVLAACFPPVTKNPIGSLQLGADRTLAGTWNAKMEDADNGDNQATFQFTRRGNTLVVLITSKKKDEDSLKAIVTTTKIGANRFMNAKLVSMGKDEDDEAPPGTVPLLYRLEGASVVLYLMNEDKTKAAIQAGKIKGSVEPGQFGDAIITANQRALDAFIASDEGVALFSEKFATLSR